MSREDWLECLLLLLASVLVLVLMFGWLLDFF